MAKQASTVIDLLSQMVGVDTVNEVTSGVPFPEQKLFELIEEIARGWNIEVSRLQIPVELHPNSYNLLLTLEVSKDAPWILFESHGDTVSVEGMKISPFITKIENDRIFGRGVCDTKGSGAGILWALNRYTQIAVKPNNIAVLFVTDEEIGKTGAKAFITKQLQELHWKPEAIFVGEPTSCRQVVAHNGVIRWKIQTKGVAAHSSKPSNGKSAISAMAKVILGFEAEYIGKLSLTHPLTGAASCSINTITGGEAVNIIPDFCEVELDRRVLPGEDSNLVLREISDAVANIASKDSDIEYELLIPFVDPALDPQVSTKISQKFSEVLESCGVSSELHGAGYGTDASTYSEFGIPAIVFGPGSFEQAHTEDEWLSLTELEKSVDIYLATMGTNFR
jgi:acetylornithine deacetylase